MMHRCRAIEFLRANAPESRGIADQKLPGQKGPTNLAAAALRFVIYPTNEPESNCGDTGVGGLGIASPSPLGVLGARGPDMKWDGYPNLRRRPSTPAKARGSIQRANHLLRMRL